MTAIPSDRIQYACQNLSNCKLVNANIRQKYESGKSPPSTSHRIYEDRQLHYMTRILFAGIWTTGRRWCQKRKQIARQNCVCDRDRDVLRKLGRRGAFMRSILRRIHRLYDVRREYRPMERLLEQSPAPTSITTMRQAYRPTSAVVTVNPQPAEVRMMDTPLIYGTNKPTAAIVKQIPSLEVNACNAGQLSKRKTFVDNNFATILSLVTDKWNGFNELISGENSVTEGYERGLDILNDCFSDVHHAS